MVEAEEIEAMAPVSEVRDIDTVGAVREFLEED